MHCLCEVRKETHRSKSLNIDRQYHSNKALLRIIYNFHKRSKYIWISLVDCRQLMTVFVKFWNKFVVVVVCLWSHCVVYQGEHILHVQETYHFSCKNGNLLLAYDKDGHRVNELKNEKYLRYNMHKAYMLLRKKDGKKKSVVQRWKRPTNRDL